MKIFGRWLLGILIVSGLLAGAWFWWKNDYRWRPKTLTRNQAEITRLLEQSGWVSPGLAGPKLYMVQFRACAECAAFKREHFARLHAAQVDTRLIAFAREESTPVERATVAELWFNRSWALAENWDNAPVEAWKAEGIAPADGDVARTAVVQAGRKFNDDLAALLKANRVALTYPTFIWWDREGNMRAFAWREGARYERMLDELAPG